jgi:hypothetical protein
MEFNERIVSKLSPIRNRISSALGVLAHKNNDSRLIYPYTDEQVTTVLSELRPATIQETEVHWPFSAYVVNNGLSSENYQYTTKSDPFSTLIAYICTKDIVGFTQILPARNLILLDTVSNPFIEIEGVNILNIRRLRIGTLKVGEHINSFAFETTWPDDDEYALAEGLIMYLNDTDRLNQWQGLQEKVNDAAIEHKKALSSFLAKQLEL